MATRYIGWFSDPVPGEISRIASAGANSVAMGPYFVMSNWNDSTVGSSPNTPSDFAAAMHDARALGLRVVLKPIIDCRSYAGEPNSAGWRVSIDPANISAWMQSYWQNCFEPFLSVVDVIAIHTELTTISTSYPGEILQLIQLIRQNGFSGPITTSNDLNPLNCPYWSALDMIGGDAYPTIRTDLFAHAVADWQGLAEQSMVAAAQTGCSVFFGELCPNIGQSMTPSETSLVYQAFWEVFGPLSFWAGAIAWRWPQDGSSPSPSLMNRFTAGYATYPDYTTPQAQ